MTPHQTPLFKEMKIVRMGRPGSDNSDKRNHDYSKASYITLQQSMKRIFPANLQCNIGRGINDSHTEALTTDEYQNRNKMAERREWLIRNIITIQR